MIDIVLLVLKIGILVLLYLFIWQVVRMAVGNVRNPAGRRRRSRRGAAGGRAPGPRVHAAGARDAPRGARLGAHDGRRAARLLGASSTRGSSSRRAPSSPPASCSRCDGWVTVGRATSSNIVLDEHFVSSTHARFVPRGQLYFVEDLGSTNGTFVNEKPVVTEAQLSLDSQGAHRRDHLPLRGVTAW